MYFILTIVTSISNSTRYIPVNLKDTTESVSYNMNKTRIIHNITLEIKFTVRMRVDALNTISQIINSTHQEIWILVGTIKRV